MANWFTNPASNTMLDNSFRNQFFQDQVRPVQSGATNVRPTNMAALRNWTPWKAFMPQSMGGTFHTGGTGAASSALGYGAAAALPLGVAGLTHMVQRGLPEELKGEGGLFDTSTAAWGGMGASAGIDPEVDETLRANAIFSGNKNVPTEEQVTEETAPHVFDPGVKHSGIPQEEKTGFFEGIGQKLGMTQVSDADRAANEQFMQDQGIYRDPTTGRMIGGDFAGKNAPGTSGWGSANFDEMRGKWVDKYGEMDYRTPFMKAKRDRLVKEEAEYQAKLIADKADAGGKTITGGKTNTGGKPTTYGGPPSSFFDPKQSHNAPTHIGQGPLHGVQQGGYMRSRYNEGGRVGILSVF